MTAFFDEGALPRRPPAVAACAQVNGGATGLCGDGRRSLSPRVRATSISSTSRALHGRLRSITAVPFGAPFTSRRRSTGPSGSPSAERPSAWTSRLRLATGRTCSRAKNAPSCSSFPRAVRDGNSWNSRGAVGPRESEGRARDGEKQHQGARRTRSFRLKAPAGWTMFAGVGARDAGPRRRRDHGAVHGDLAPRTRRPAIPGSRPRPSAAERRSRRATRWSSIRTSGAACCSIRPRRR